jgi:catechol 2,3-dioxygenase-like lactoylglutathione lyase family enzyme
VTRPRALWLPFEVPDLDAAREFYDVHLGLSPVDSWSRERERGVVLRAAGAAYVELVSPGTPAPPPLAFELDGVRAVDEAYARWRVPAGDLIAAPHVYPRGHYGFEVQAPGNASVMVWSER